MKKIGLLFLFVSVGSFSYAVEPDLPMAQRDVNGETTLDWSAVTDALVADLKQSGSPLQVSEAHLYMDGRFFKKIPITGDRKLKFSLNPGDQYKFEILYLDRDDKPIHRTKTRLLEIKVPPSVNPISYKNFPVGFVELPEAWSRSLQIDDGLTPAVFRISREKAAYLFRDKDDAKVKGLSVDADVQVRFSKDESPARVEVCDHHSNKMADLSNKDVLVKVDAAFNGNEFFWDDMTTSQGVMYDDPRRVRDTILHWVDIQEKHKPQNGVIPREVLKKDVSVSYNPYEEIKNGKIEPNPDYTNPNLMGWTTENLVDLTGPSEENKKLIERVIQSMEAYGKWQDSERAIVDSSGTKILDPKTKRPLGYYIGHLGSGMDNVPGPEGRGVGSVSELARRIDLEKSAARLYARLGKEKESQASERSAAEIEGILNRYYWSQDQSYYFDVVGMSASGNSILDTKNPTVSGFWPLWSGSADSTRVDQIVKKWWNEKGFGGSFPCPSLPRSHPEYHSEGAYWRGGYWAILWSMCERGWEKSGHPELAFESATKALKGVSQVSSVFEKRNGRKTVFEFNGETKVGNEKIMIPGVQKGHTTRSDFTGWGMVTPTSDKLRYVVGLRSVSAFFGDHKDQEAVRAWLRALAFGSAFKNATYISQSPVRDRPDQVALVAEGFKELNLARDLGKESINMGNLYLGPRRLRGSLSVEKKSQDIFRVRLKSDEPYEINLAINRMDRRVVAMSPIQKIKLDHPGEVIVEFKTSTVGSSQ